MNNSGSAPSFANDLWDSFETICTKLKQGSTFCRAYMKFYKEFSIETKEYAKKIKELLKTPQEEFGTMNIGWIAIKQEIESIANLHNRMADEITYKVITPIETQLKDTSRAKRKGRENGRKLIEAIGESVKTISLAKVEYEKAMRISDQSKSDYERASNFNELSSGSKLKKKYDTDRKKAESMEKKYRRTIDKGKILENRLFDSEMPEILNEFEQIERKRLYTIKGSMEAFKKCYLDSIPSIESICKKMQVALDNINPDGDVNDFINDKKSGKEKDAQRFEFEPFSPQYKVCMKEGEQQASLSRSNTMTSQSLPTITRSATDLTSPTYDFNQLQASQNTNQQSPSSSINVLPNSPSLTSMQSLSTSNSSSSLQMNLQPQVIAPTPQPQIITSSSSSGSVVASSSGITSISNSATSNAKNDSRLSKSMSGVPVKGIGYCRALFDYDASQPSELSFKKNDVITIYEKDASGWWVGEVRGKMGFFPSVDWVEEIPAHLLSLPQPQQPQPQPQVVQQPQPQVVQQPQPQVVQQPQPPPQPSKRICKAIFPMTAINPNELTLREGEFLTIEGEAEGWYYGTNQMGQSGMFPASFVSIVN